MKDLIFTARLIEADEALRILADPDGFANSAAVAHPRLPWSPRSSSRVTSKGT